MHQFNIADSGYWTLLLGSWFAAWDVSRPKKATP